MGTVTLPGVAASVARARQFIEAALVDQGIPRETRNDVVLVASELAANAVVHGGGSPDTFEVAYEIGTDRVTVRVLDAARSATGPVRLSPDERRPSGRGLQIVERLADWSERIVDGRREVQANMDLPSPIHQEETERASADEER